ncbi:MAG: type I DNA topoisomerase [Candidatus Yanofskybacteria bacterium]|nr:type I DNA topoisomerase [Candidatus Yanofskybacteria bacterium]
MNLIVVESPTKGKTISRFLGSEFLVKSSFGHVRDLPKSKLGVDVEHDFKPQYVIPAKAKKVISELKEALKDSDKLILATDQDREGEGIAWHLTEALNTKNKTVERIVFHEITKSAIQKALENPRSIDMNLVDAQQARRVLDRLVGYELSPFLWRKIRYGLSAGRVQSVAVRLVVEREREIQNFKKEEYWSVEADLNKKGDPEKPPSDHGASKKTFRAKLNKVEDKTIDKLAVKNEFEAKKIIDELSGASYVVKEINKKEVIRNPAAPFTTSTLQQEASRKLGMSAKQTMMLAQQLYEGINIGEHGETGLITYMRTDSLNLAESALVQSQQVIREHFGREYALDQPRHYTTKTKGAQEAHEAIRPTDLFRRPETIRQYLDLKQFKIYDLIWKRTIASQMQPAVFDQTGVDISAGPKYTFRASGQVVKFDGFIKAYTEGLDETEEEVEGQLPELLKEEILDLESLLPLQHFTEPPPRYTDASLVKALEAHGVGRPSTYAPTLATIQDREYVEKIEKKYHPTEIGFLVNDMLVENFPEIVDINFTSHIEEELDNIAEGKSKWVPVIEEFYTPFKKHLKEKEASVEKLEEQTETPCPKCGKKMVIKFGRMGKFLACPDIECKTTKPLPEEEAKIKELEEKTKDERCPICSKPMAVKRGRFGYFLGCSDYPKCKGILKILNKTGFKCPHCLVGDVVEKKSRGRGKVFYACSRFPDCTFIMGKKPESESELQEVLKHWQENPPKIKSFKSKKHDSKVADKT